MCYCKKTEYRILPTESYKIIRGCPGCGGRAFYRSTGNFRVNANGKQIDVWLIYQCEKCKTTYNLPIYERVRRTDIPGEIYHCFLENDCGTALRCGTDRKLFARSRAEIDWENLSYEIVRTGGGTDLKEDQEKCDIIVVENPYELKVRTDRVVAEICHMSRSRIRRMVRAGELELPQNYLGRRMEIRLT